MSWKSQWTFWAKIGFSWCHLLLDNSFVASLGLSSCCSNPRQNCKAWKLCSLIGESLAMSWGLRESVSARERCRARFQSPEWVVARTVRPRTHFSTPRVGRQCFYQNGADVDFDVLGMSVDGISQQLDHVLAFDAATRKPLRPICQTSLVKMKGAYLTPYLSVEAWNNWRDLNP